MHPIEETLASYLSQGDRSSLKTPTMLSKPLRTTSRLNGRAYVAVGQVMGALHMMAVLQAYQVELLKDLDLGQGLSPGEITDLHHITDLALRSTKQTATVIGHSIVMVAMGRHLWLNLSDIKEKEKAFLLYVSVSPSCSSFKE